MANCIPLLQQYVNGTDAAYCEMSLSGMIIYIIILFLFIWLIKDLIESYKKPLLHFGEERVRKIVHRLVLLTVLFGTSLFISNLFERLVTVKSDGLVFYRTLPYSFIIFMAMYIYVYYIGTKKYMTDKGIFDRD